MEQEEDNDFSSESIYFAVQVALADSKLLGKDLGKVLLKKVKKMEQERDYLRKLVKTQQAELDYKLTKPMYQIHKELESSKQDKKALMIKV